MKSNGTTMAVSYTHLDVYKRQVYNGAAEWLKSWAKVPADEWMKLMEQWNPEKFNAKTWRQRAC